MRLFARSAAPTVFRAYLRGRLRAAGVLPDAEAKLYAAPDLPTPLLIAFVLGALCNTEEPLPSESEIEQAVKARLAPAAPGAPPAAPAAPAAPTDVGLGVERRFVPPRAPGVGEVEVRVGKGKGRDDGGGGSAPAAAVRWIGEPLAPSSPAG